MNRETWLSDLVSRMRPQFSARGCPIPPALQVSCGWPSRRARPGSNQVIGQCFPVKLAADARPHLFVSPMLAKPEDIAHVLAHELVHAWDDCAHGHKGPFIRAIRALGLEGKPTATVAGPAFVAWSAPILAELGPYPHGALTIADPGKKQGTRLLKVSCPDCGYIARVTRLWLVQAGPPLCPNHGPMVEESDE